MFKILVPFTIILTSLGCARAYGNKQTLYTHDCGVSWQLIQAGKSIPVGVTPCSYSISLPDHPMQGEVRFKTSFSGRVLAQVEVSYDYSIVDAVTFVSEAKYLGKANSDGNDATNSGYESAENSVIDKRIREIAATLLIKENIVDFNQAKFEEELLVAVNEMLADKGVRLNFLSFVPIPDLQTRLAIDALTAMKVYETEGLGVLGQQIMVARAGACEVSVESTPAKE